MDKGFDHLQLLRDLQAMLADEDDWTAAMATVACEIFQRDEKINWAGFYRVVAPDLLKVGPYQGTHGCLEIPFNRGICGRAAREARSQRVDDVLAEPEHIACSSSTRSELVIPILDRSGDVQAVLDLDAALVSYFSAQDLKGMERLTEWLGVRYFHD